MGDLRDSVLDLITDLHATSAKQDSAEAIGWVAATHDPEQGGRAIQLVGMFGTEIEAATWLDAHVRSLNAAIVVGEKSFVGAVYPVMPVDR